jgi:hypothetical protein
MDAFVGLLLLLIWFMLVVVPVVRILRRLGLSEWFVLIALIPLGHLFGVWALAFSEWPAMRPPSPRELDQWSGSDDELFKKLLDERRL